MALGKVAGLVFSGSDDWSVHASETAMMLFGISTALMWVRTLNFVMVQKDLGQVRGIGGIVLSHSRQCCICIYQCTSIKIRPRLSMHIYKHTIHVYTRMQFVRVMMNMGQDLAFFSIAWCILILAFRCTCAYFLGLQPSGQFRDRERANSGTPVTTITPLA